MIRTGGCRCGNLRYSVNAEPAVVRLCWCRDCQYWALGSAAVNLVVAREAVRLEGDATAWESFAESGRRMRRSFCPKCGTHIFSQCHENTSHMVVRAGSLDDPDSVTPTAVIWTDSAPPWAYIDPNLHAFSGQPG